MATVRLNSVRREAQGGAGRHNAMPHPFLSSGQLVQTRRLWGREGMEGYKLRT